MNRLVRQVPLHLVGLMTVPSTTIASVHGRRHHPLLGGHRCGIGDRGGVTLHKLTVRLIIIHHSRGEIVTFLKKCTFSGVAIEKVLKFKT